MSMRAVHLWLAFVPLGLGALTQADPALGNPAADPTAGAPRASHPSPADSLASPLSYTHWATRLDGVPPPRVDGQLDDEAWALAPPIDGFVQRDPEEGAPASERTEARLLYDAEAIYIGIHAFDSEPERIFGLLTRRDEWSESDWLQVSLDSFGDHRTAFDFEVNPVGVKRDLYRFDDTGEDYSWDAVWDAATRIQEDGWCAEFRIPFSQLRFAAGEDRVWGIQLARQIVRRNELDLWKPIAKGNDRWVSEYAALGGIAGVNPPRRLELLPYTVGGSKIEPAEAGNPFATGRDYWGRIGLDLKYGVTSDLTLDATVNPDFGQVEVDPSVINLTEFETFFPEKRPFFLEGTDKFNWGLSVGDGPSEPLFYSRRVGRSPQGDADGDYVDYPDNTTILGAAKLSGKTAGGVSLGVIEAVTQEEAARVRQEDGSRDRTVVEPLTNYMVVRVARDLRQGETAVGGIATATNRRIEGTGLDWLHSSAYAAGADLRHRINDRGWTVRGKGALSHVRGAPDALIATQESSRRYFQRPDASHVRLDSSLTSMTGGFATFELGKFAGQWRGTLNSQVRSPDFEINDLGFQRRADEIYNALWIGHQNYTPGRLFRRRNTNWNLLHKTNFGGEKLLLSGSVNANAEFTNYWSAWTGVNYDAETLHATALRGGPAMIRPPAYNVWAGFETDSRKPGSMTFDTWWWHQPEGHTWSTGAELAFYFRVASNVSASLGQSYQFLHDDWSYVSEEYALGAPQYVMARLVQHTCGLTGRMNWTLTPDLSLQAYASPFLSAGLYSDYRRVVAPRAKRYEDRFDYFGDPGSGRLTFDGETYSVDIDGDETGDIDISNPDFNFRQFRASLVLRWEYLPGSTLFLVYQHDRTDETSNGAFRPGADLGNLWDAAGAHTLLVKVSYWWSL